MTQLVMSVLIGLIETVLSVLMVMLYNLTRPFVFPSVQAGSLKMNEYVKELLVL